MLDYYRFPVTAHNRLVKRQLITDNALWFKEGVIHEDYHWTYFLAKFVDRLAVCDVPTYNYRMTPGSITHKVNLEKKANSYRYILKDFCNNIDDFLVGEQKKRILILLYTIIGFQFFNKNQEYECFSCLYQKCNTIERSALWMWYHTHRWNYLYDRLFRLCLRIFVYEEDRNFEKQ